jgi:hypothetical protein
MARQWLPHLAGIPLLNADTKNILCVTEITGLTLSGIGRNRPYRRSGTKFLMTITTLISSSVYVYGLGVTIILDAMAGRGEKRSLCRPILGTEVEGQHQVATVSPSSKSEEFADGMNQL